ncbi:MAG TPA: LacI family DNA-binding transcriptional regulator [Propioniciclava sp.]|jgi:DNA-binding LacI/PurR family transcriptional regulator|uniref:LacI family DNA-binding transcriptional regulator n=1 Tax=Propioniciclava sp. TaxID=2038686 RepID=UPI002BEE898C|nr:LacI family DNA-binding transcriptional regulator [Propioniciclava sp.]HRL48958.1 LacI family DNA-binding transcriptional regulator [Propioniciclava sp.]HRL79306.1 LacI family DNA-binding transcriptional regulator [Propioniciclava sp.]
MTPPRRATAADVARSVGVSRATVGYVLNDTPGQTISATTRDKVIETARTLGYRPRAAAQALATGRTHLVLLVLPDWPQDYSVRRYIEEATLVLDEGGYTLVTWAPHTTGKTRPLWQQLDPDVVVGFAPFSESDVASMRQHGIRAIFPDASDTLASADTAEQAGTHGPVLQVEHLHELGHRRIAIASTSDPRLAVLAQQRADVAARTAAACGMVCLSSCDVDRPDLDRASLVSDWVADGVTGVVAYNDEIAALVVGAALTAGLRIPEQLSVVGHDDSPLASLFVPSLTSVRLDGAALGRLIADLILAKLDGRRLTRVPTGAFETLIPRHSTSRTGLLRDR